MGEPKLVQIDTFFDSLAAQQAKNWLDQQGIPAFVEGANANSAFYVGSALVGVKLLVATKDQERARCVLLQYHSESSDRTSWYCGECKELNEPSFDLCWSCGKNREDVEQPAPIQNSRRPSETIDDEPIVGDIPQSIDTGNPYQPPLVMQPANQNLESQLDFEHTVETEKTEEDIQRAWRASILGLLIPIPILHLYSVFLLLGVDRTVPISSKSQRQFRLAWSINIILILIVCIAIRSIVVR